MSDKVNAKLYKIQDLILDEYSDFNILVDKMIDDYFKRNGNKFKEINLKKDLSKEDYTARLFVFSTPKRDPNWLDFLIEIVSDSASLDNLM